MIFNQNVYGYYNPYGTSPYSQYSSSRHYGGYGAQNIYSNRYSYGNNNYYGGFYDNERFKFQITQYKVNQSLSIKAYQEKDMEDNPDKITDTKTLVNFMFYSDLDKNGKVTKSEIGQYKAAYNDKIDSINRLKEQYPDYAEYYDRYIDLYQDQLDVFNLIDDNFNAFSSEGKNDEIDSEDLVNLYKKAGTDGKYNDFTQEDLNEMKGTTSPDEPEYKFDDWADMWHKINDDKDNTLEQESRGKDSAGNIIGHITFADKDKDGLTTKSELTDRISETQARLDAFSYQINAIQNSNTGYYVSQLNVLQEIYDILQKDLTNSKMIYNNFDTFNSTGNSKALDADDLWNIHQASKSDGDNTNFSFFDFEKLKKMN